MKEEKENLDKKYKLNRTLITINCDFCGIEFEKPKSEFDRNVRTGKRNFCCRSCSGKAPKINPSQWNKSEENKAHLKSISGNRNDEFTPFRYSLACAKRRFKEINITLLDLQEIWNNQKGICPYSNISLILPTSADSQKDSIFRASLDRINSNLGYIKENIQFVSTPINYMKNTMSDLEIKSFIDLIVKNYNIVSNDIL